MKYSFWFNFCVFSSVWINTAFVAPLPYHSINKLKQLAFSKGASSILRAIEENNAPKSSLEGRAIGLSNDLINLHTVVENDQVKFVWTSGLNDVKRYIIQSSSDLEHYQDIAEIKAGRINESLTYTDNILSEDAAKFYRILAVKSDKNLQVFAPLAIYRPEMNGLVLLSDGQSDQIRIRLEDFESAEILLSTGSGMGVPFQINQKSKKEVVLIPSYELSNGEYQVRLRTNKGERKLRFIVSKSDKMF